MVNAALAKENVYKMQEFSLPEIDGDDYNVVSTAHKDGMVYLMVEVYHWSENREDTDIRLISMKEDGSDVQVRPLEMPATESNESSGGADTQDAGESGTVTDMPVVDVGGDIWEYNNYSYYTFAGDGKIYAVRQYQYENYTDPEKPVSRREFYLDSWNADGSFLGEKTLGSNSSEDEEYLWINSMSVASDGSVYVMMQGEKSYKVIVDAQGNVSERTAMPEEVATLFQNYDRLVSREDGSFLIMYYDENDWTKEYIATYDLVTDTLGEPVQMPSNLSWNGFNTLAAGKNSDLIYSNNNGVYTYNMGDTEGTMKMSFINSDLNISNLVSLVELDNGSLVAMFYENYGEKLRGGIFTYVDPKDIPDKAVLVLGGNYIGNDMKQRIVEFNRTSEEYRIVVKDYSTYNNYDDYQAGYKQLNNDIITGNMPDILITDGIPVENYEAKGLLVDVGKLIEQDEELSQVEFVQNVFDAYSVNGKLYRIIPYFGVQTMVAKTSLVGDRTSWTMEDAQNLVNSMPEGTALIGELTRGGFFTTMMSFCARDFIDVSTGKCDFNSANFIKMMEYAKGLPTELDEEYYGEDYWMNYQSQYRDNRTILCNLSIGSISNLNYTINGRIGEDVSYIGFPTESGMGSYINAYASYAISARSANIDGAWEFLRYYLTDEYQSQLEWGLSVYMKYFKENAQKALEKPYYMDENGEKVEYDETFYLNGESIVLPQMTQAQIDKAVNFILSVNKCYYSNEEVMNIINEEMEAFYSGQKSAQDVATVIQSRAQLYVDENR